MRWNYPLFQSHLDAAHAYWKQLVQPGDTVIDATCGNGHDTLLLAQLCLTPSSGKVFAIDTQPNAIQKTLFLLQQHLAPECYERVQFVNGCHSSFPTEIQPQTIKLVTYNLGYLPGGNKSLTTKVTSTLQSLGNALPLVSHGGAISITCYPGHPEGKREEEKLLSFISDLEPQEWQCTHQCWLNRHNAPSLILIQKSRLDQFNSQMIE